MFKKWGQEIHLLELIAVFLLVCTAGFYLMAYLNFETNSLTPLYSDDQGEGIVRAEAMGLAGDFLGGVLNPVLSFFSFLAVLVTLRLQRRELTATMDDLKRSTEAAEANVRLFTEQLGAQRLDAFENTFFSLLKLHNSTFETINEPQDADGDRPAGSPLQVLMAQARSQGTLEEARAVLMSDHSEIDHFISILFEMLKFIDQKFPQNVPSATGTTLGPDRTAQPDPQADRMFYANILKAIINQDAFEAIALYAATHHPQSPYFAFKQLIEKYQLLEELDLSAAPRQHLRSGYAHYFAQLGVRPAPPTL